LSPGEIFVVKNRVGIVLTPGQDPIVETEEEHQASAFCGHTDGQFRSVFDATHNVTICMSCLETPEET
jgi:hypothetical protein